MAAGVTMAPRVLRRRRHRQPSLHSDPIGRTCLYGFGGRVEIEIPLSRKGKLKYIPVAEPREWTRNEPDNPSFRRHSPKGYARALRDACELHVEVLRDGGIDASYKPLVIWSDSSVQVVGPKNRLLCHMVIESGRYPRKGFLETWGKDLDSFLHLGECIPPGVRWNLTTSSYLLRGPAVPFLKRLSSGQGVVLAGARPRAPRVDLWLMDTGSGVDIVDRSSVEPVKERIRPHQDGIVLNTVNGSTPVEEEIDLFLKEFGHQTTAFVMPDTPSILTIGYRCQAMGCGFHWDPWSGTPYMDLPSGKRV